MARIIYGVHGTGHGHAIRALTVARHFAEHEFLFLSHGAGAAILSPEFQVLESPCLVTVVRQHKVAPLATLYQDAVILSQSWASRRRLRAEAFKNGVDHYVKKGGDQTSQFAELSHVVRNAVELRENEEEIALLNRIDALHRRINEAVVHIHDRRQLAQEVCRIMIQEGGFVLAWIGFEDPVTARIDTVFASGETDEFFGKVRLLSEDISHGQGPTVTTIKKGKYTICNDIQAFPDLQMWEDDAIRKGYQSAAAFPLSTGKTTRGAITLYSIEKNFFTETEIRLLNGISEEISWVLKTMEMLDSSRQIRGDLELSEHRLTEIINFLPLATFATDTAGSSHYLEQGNGETNRCQC